jgi:RNA polymerase sigma-70 factor (ECF subfamily)
LPIGEGFDEVLSAAKAGADWAWKEIYLDLSGPITGYLASRGATEPEDLAGETFLHMARAIHSFQGNEGSFRSWVFVIAHRRMIDARRSASRTVVSQSATEIEAKGGNVEEEAVDQLTTAELVRALEVLTDEQREVLALRVIADLSLQETADVMEKTVGAVKGLQRRALESLRKHLDADGVSKSDSSTITEMK